MCLTKGNTYKWADILRETGAANVLPYYLLRPRGGRTIVAASLDIATNPRAPYEIWAGNGREIKRWADVLERQADPFAVVVREADGQHYYRGRFKCVAATTDQSEIALRGMQAERTDIYKILFLEELS
jgi:hypothetical protein